MTGEVERLGTRNIFVPVDPRWAVHATNDPGSTDALVA